MQLAVVSEPHILTKLQQTCHANISGVLECCQMRHAGPTSGLCGVICGVAANSFRCLHRRFNALTSLAPLDPNGASFSCRGGINKGTERLAAPYGFAGHKTRV